MSYSYVSVNTFDSRLLADFCKLFKRHDHFESDECGIEDMGELFQTVHAVSRACGTIDGTNLVGIVEKNGIYYVLHRYQYKKFKSFCSKKDFIFLEDRAYSFEDHGLADAIYYWDITKPDLPIATFKLKDNKCDLSYSTKSGVAYDILCPHADIINFREELRVGSHLIEQFITGKAPE